ncbi:MAG: hypothetical protein JW844_00165 [Candidatus Omnitrophica bacterium]|nr:hypothetical protein [Candidatus Omnitrophota bacterium]
MFMHRTEMYIRKDQIDALQDIAYVKTKEVGKRTSISKLVREAIDVWLREQEHAEVGR